jgi:hypothetical protein
VECDGVRMKTDMEVGEANLLISRVRDATSANSQVERKVGIGEIRAVQGSTTFFMSTNNGVCSKASRAGKKRKRTA